MPSQKNDYPIGKNVHFTYKPECDRNTLSQGDILSITDDLKAALSTIHPYFEKGQYKYFMVLSQSCDLVRRNDKLCKSPYITLAAIRSYDDFLRKTFLNNGYAEEYSGLLLMEDKNRQRALQLLERVYNNTEPEYFFLYEEQALNFNKSMVVYLRVSIALKSKEHYETCLKAKTLELAEEFKAKLGWLVGNMYSRVGTKDWDSERKGKEKEDRLKKDLNSLFIISTKENLKQLKQDLDEKKDELTTRESVLKHIANYSAPTKHDKLMQAIEELIKNTGKNISDDEKDKLINAIKSSHKIKNLI